MARQEEAWIEKLLILDKTEHKAFKLNNIGLEKGLIAILDFSINKYGISLKKLEQEINNSNKQL